MTSPTMSGSPAHSTEAHSPTSVPPPLPSSVLVSADGPPLPSEPDLVKVKPAALVTEQDAVSSDSSSGSSRYAAKCFHVRMYTNTGMLLELQCRSTPENNR